MTKHFPDDMPRDLADMLGRVAENATPRRTEIAERPANPVKTVAEDGFWAVFFNDVEIGWIDRCAFSGGYRAVTKGGGSVEHTHTFSTARDFLVSNAI